MTSTKCFAHHICLLVLNEWAWTCDPTFKTVKLHRFYFSNTNDFKRLWNTKVGLLYFVSHIDWMLQVFKISSRLNSRLNLLMFCCVSLCRTPWVPQWLCAASVSASPSHQSLGANPGSPAGLGLQRRRAAPLQQSAVLQHLLHRLCLLPGALCFLYAELTIPKNHQASSYSLSKARIAGFIS